MFRKLLLARLLGGGGGNSAVLDKIREELLNGEW